MHSYRLLGLLTEFGMKDDLRKIEVGGVSCHDLYVKREFQYTAMSPDIYARSRQTGYIQQSYSTAGKAEAPVAASCVLFWRSAAQD